MSVYHICISQLWNAEQEPDVQIYTSNSQSFCQIVNPPKNVCQKSLSKMKSPVPSEGTVQTTPVYVSIPVKSVSLFFYNHI